MLKRPMRIVFQVPDLSAAKAWYARLLGADPVFETPQAAIFQVGDGSLTLAPGPAALPEDSGRVSVYWEVDDVDEAFARVLEFGGVAHAEPRNIFSIRGAQARDPFGTVIGLTGHIRGAERKTVENQPSATALNVSLIRALASRDDRPEIRRPDKFAELFLPDSSRALLADAASRDAAVNELISRPLYAFCIARFAFIDAIFERAVAAGLPQIVFLGAGYDTRALRFRDRLGGTRVFELDAPATQNRKRETLRAASIAVPPQVAYVPVNFKTDDAGGALAKAGFDPGRKSLFICEGVLYYLPPAAVDGLLRTVRDSSPAGSFFCFDYLTERMNSVNPGEPFLSWIEPERLGSFLEERGFRLADHADPADMTKSWLTLQDGTVAEKPMTRLNLALAERVGRVRA